jgi:uncharacterized protein (TIRG00374 family)
MRMRAQLQWVAASTALCATAVVLVRAGTGLADVAAFASPRAHLLTIAIVGIDLCCRGARMLLLARALGLRVSLRRSVGAQLAGESAAAMTPSRVGSDAGRMLVLRHGGIDLSRAAAIVVAEMVFEVAALVLVVGVIVLLLPYATLAAPAVFAYAVVVLITTFGAIIIARAAYGDPPGWWRRLRFSAERWNTLRMSAGRFSDAWDAWVRMRPTTIFLILFLSAVHITGRIAVLPALLSDRLEPELLGPSISWPLVLFHAGALVPLPAAGGAVELMFGATLGTALGDRVGAALVWWRVYTFYLLAASGGLVLAWLARPRAALRAAGIAES